MSSIRPRRPSVNRSGPAIAALILLAIVAGCSTSPLPPEPVIDTSDQLIDALRQAGATVEESQSPASLGDLEGGRTLTMGGARLEAFDFDSSEARQIAASTLTEAEATGVPANRPLVAWGRGRLIVAYHGSDGGVIALLSGLIGDPLTLPRDVMKGPYPPGVAAAIAFLAQDLGQDPGRIVVVAYEASEWPDTCLGLGQAGEVCGPVATSGWRIVLRLDAATYVVRSDEFGQVLRRE